MPRRVVIALVALALVVSRVQIVLANRRPASTPPPHRSRRLRLSADARSRSGWATSRASSSRRSTSPSRPGYYREAGPRGDVREQDRSGPRHPRRPGRARHRRRRRHERHPGRQPGHPDPLHHDDLRDVPVDRLREGVVGDHVGGRPRGQEDRHPRPVRLVVDHAPGAARLGGPDARRRRRSSTTRTSGRASRSRRTRSTPRPASRTTSRSSSSSSGTEARRAPCRRHRRAAGPGAHRRHDGPGRQARRDRRRSRNATLRAMDEIAADPSKGVDAAIAAVPGARGRSRRRRRRSSTPRSPRGRRPAAGPTTSVPSIARAGRHRSTYLSTLGIVPNPVTVDRLVQEVGAAGARRRRGIQRRRRILRPWPFAGSCPRAAPDRPFPTDASDTETVRRIAGQLDALPVERARFLAAFAYILTRAAAADMDISHAESRAIEQLVAEHGGLPESQAVLVAQIAHHQSLLYSGTEDYLVTRQFRELATQPTDRLALLRCCYLVGAADDTITAHESDALQQIAKELDIERDASTRSATSSPRSSPRSSRCSTCEATRPTTSRRPRTRRPRRAPRPTARGGSATAIEGRR